jgi:hypothetical protein
MNMTMVQRVYRACRVHRDSELNDGTVLEGNPYKAPGVYMIATSAGCRVLLQMLTELLEDNVEYIKRRIKCIQVNPGGTFRLRNGPAENYIREVSQHLDCVVDKISSWNSSFLSAKQRTERPNPSTKTDTVARWCFAQCLKQEELFANYPLRVERLNSLPWWTWDTSVFTPTAPKVPPKPRTVKAAGQTKANGSGWLEKTLACLLMYRSQAGVRGASMETLKEDMLPSLTQLVFGDLEPNGTPGNTMSAQFSKLRDTVWFVHDTPSSKKAGFSIMFKDTIEMPVHNKHLSKLNAALHVCGVDAIPPSKTAYDLHMVFSGGFLHITGPSFTRRIPHLA